MNLTALILVPWMVAAAALCGVLFFCLSANKGQEAGGDPRVDELVKEAAALTERVAELESREKSLPAPAPARAVAGTGMSSNKREQALRQSREGLSPTAIAQELDLSSAEVDLLIKIQRITAAQN